MNIVNLVPFFTWGMLIIVLIIIGREVIAWYFKINRIVALLERIEENTRPKGLAREPLKKSDKLI
jgi:hypothetical protein